MPPPDPSRGFDAAALLRSRAYVRLVVVVALLGWPVAAVAYWFLKITADLQKWVYDPAYLPKWLGFHGTPVWWPFPMLVVGGLVAGAAIRYLPGRGGHSPADGFHAGGVPAASALPGIALAALASLAMGAVIGPEAPLIALGGGLAAAAVRAVKPGLPGQSVAVIGAAGSFSAVSTLLGSPLSGAFLLMEASGLGGPMLGPVLVPGLLAAGIGTLTFIGFDAWTGYGTFSLAIPNLAPVGTPNGAEFAWAIGIGLAATVVGGTIRWLALRLKPVAERWIVVAAPAAGVVVAGAAVLYSQVTGHGQSQVLYSGQAALPQLVTAGAGYTAGALALLMVCKGIAYTVSLAGFRGGPTFPGMFIGGAGGLLLSHLPGLPEVAGAAMGIGAMTCSMLGLPLTSVLLTTLFMGTDGLNLMPLVIVAVVVSYIGRAYLRMPAGPPEPAAPAATAPAATPSATASRS